MMRRTVVLTMLVGALAWAQDAAPVAPGGGPWWQSEQAAALQNQVRSAQIELWRLQAAEPRDEAAIAAKQAEVDRLRAELYALRDRERGGQPPCLNPAVGPRGGGGPWWQSEQAAALQSQVRSAQIELWRLQAAEPRDEAAIAAKQAEVDRLRAELQALRVSERTALGPACLAPGGGMGQGARNGMGYGRRGGRGGGPRWQR